MIDIGEQSRNNVSAELWEEVFELNMALEEVEESMAANSRGAERPKFVRCVRRATRELFAQSPRMTKVKLQPWE